MVRLDSRLHSPMYYFLKHLSWLEIIITTTVIPKMLSILISEKKTISFFACAIQVTLYFLAGTTEVLLLGAMSVDRYLTICNPLRYTAIMSSQVCLLMVLFCWFISFVCIAVGVVSKSELPYCGPNVIDHFFCDTGPLTKLLCADTSLVQAIEFASSCFTLLSSVSVTTISYICIIVTVMRMPSAQGRNKAFSTCSSHINVASLYYGSSIFIYVRASGSSSIGFNKVAKKINTTVVTPLLNPIIYSFRNKAVKDALKDRVKQLGSIFANAVIKNYQQVLAFWFAVKEVSGNPRLLANVTMRFHIYDSYFNDNLTFQTTLNLLYSLKTILPYYKCDSEKNLVAIIGALHSETSFHMATMSKIYKIPQ
ncbi:olfactory receptor 6M1-like, partial [Python bivittatus]|uniref:Olfactory receptor n=1 Tax=Python bivittatus TaxID=176946 RepID=A0A9F5N0G7_PYTBI